jgi:hypothetical protein
MDATILVRLAPSPPYSKLPVLIIVPQNNDPTVFTWRGSIPLLFGGDHSFSFEASKTNPGGTTFTQEEQFFGALGFLMGEGFVANKAGFREKTLKGWEGFNMDLKKWCEAPEV